MGARLKYRGSGPTGNSVNLADLVVLIKIINKQVYTLWIQLLSLVPVIRTPYRSSHNLSCKGVWRAEERSGIHTSKFGFSLVFSDNFSKTKLVTST